MKTTTMTPMEIVEAARIACDEYNAQFSRNMAHKLAEMFTRKHIAH